MKKIVILAVALATRGTFAALVMDDTKEFFEGGEMLPGRVANCPSPSLRAAAVLPEIYGVLSAWMERIFLYYHTSNGFIVLPEDMKSCDLFRNMETDWDYPYNQVRTNRVVTERMTWWPLVNAIAKAMRTGPPSMTRNKNGLGFFTMGANASSRLKGKDFPTIDWTTNVVDAVPADSWIGIWPCFIDCPTDGVWKTEYLRDRDLLIPYQTYRVIGSLYDGEFSQDYPELLTSITNWKSSTTCLDLLRGEIGDDAYFLTNRTLRLDRRYLTALEYALGLCDTYVLASWPGANGLGFLDLTYRTTKQSDECVSANWKFNGISNTITIRPDRPSFDNITNVVRVVTNFNYFADTGVAWCGGSTESLKMSANTSFYVIMKVSDLYNVMTTYTPQAPDQDMWLYSGHSFSLDGSTLVYDFTTTNNDYRSLTFLLEGEGALNILATGTQENRVKFSSYEVNTSLIPPPMPLFLMKYGFVYYVDVAWGLNCVSFDGYVPFVGYPVFPEGAHREHALEQFTVYGTTNEWVSTLSKKMTYMGQHARGHVASMIGGDVEDIPSMLPLTQSQNYKDMLLSNYLSVASGGPATIGMHVFEVSYDRTLETVTVVDESGTNVYPANSDNIIIFAIIGYENTIQANVRDCHVPAAASEVSQALNQPPIRAVMLWRNCSF